MDLLWIFDHSSGHMIYAKNALKARLINVKPGGGQPRMRPGRLPDEREYLLFLGRHRRPYIVFRNYVNVWLPVLNLVYIYISVTKMADVRLAFVF